MTCGFFQSISRQHTILVKDFFNGPVDVEVRAAAYIALWGGDAKGLRASLERIADTARSIIDDVEGAEAGKAVA